MYYDSVRSTEYMSSITPSFPLIRVHLSSSEKGKREKGKEEMQVPPLSYAGEYAVFVVHISCIGY